MERSSPLTEQLVDICLSDDSENESLFHNEDDQAKIISDTFSQIRDVFFKVKVAWRKTSTKYSRIQLFFVCTEHKGLCLASTLLHVLLFVCLFDFNNESIKAY